MIHGMMTWVSYDFVHGQGHRQRPFFTFLGLYGAAFFVYWRALHLLPHCSRSRCDMGMIFGFALLFRVVLLWSNPIQEDDFYRYLWDGKVVVSGLNPYRFAPRQVESYTGEAEAIQPYTQLVKEDVTMATILARVNHPDVPTIYPPLAQAMFAIAAWVAPGNLLALRLLFLVFDVGVCVVLTMVLMQLAINPVYVLIYAWSPLVLKESLNSVHYDVVPTFFLIGALWFSLTNKALWAHGSLALAVLGKVYPLVFFPLLAWRTWQRHGGRKALCGGTLMAVLMVVGYLPFVDAGPSLWQGTRMFAERWQTNSLLFPLLVQLVGGRWVVNTVVGALLSGLVIVVFRYGDLRDGRTFVWSVFVVLGGLLLLSPVGNPWYFLWIMPLLCVFPLRSWLLLSGLLGLYYLSFYFIYHRTPETFRWIIWLEYVPFYALLVWEWMTVWSHNGFAPPAESFLHPAVQSFSQPDDKMAEETAIG